MNRLKYFVLIVVAVLMGCGLGRAPKPKYPMWIETDAGWTCTNTTDSTFKFMGMDECGMDTGFIYVHPGDTFPVWHPWWYPDTIKVAFTRDGVFEDSIEVFAGRIPIDSTDGVYYSRSAVGDAFYYNLKGQFTGSYEADVPHSRDDHDYRP